jgi:hypothetical protein
VTPPPLPAPALLFHTPENNAEHGLDKPVELTFDQPMDQSSVEAAFTITPSVSGELSWADARTLKFVPQTSLARGTRYKIRVDKSARNVEGKSLADPVQFDFQTVGYLAVSEVQPAPTSEDIDPHTAVTVIFNRPVVPLTALSRQDELPDPLTFLPSVQGEGEWLNTSIYRFQPTEGFQPATVYKARIAAGLEDTMDGILEEDYTWVFTTLRPAVWAWHPRTNAEHVAPGAHISVTFNQPMDHAATEAAFSLKVGGQPIAGTFRWADAPDPSETDTRPRAWWGSKPPESAYDLQGETMAFVPDAPLPRNASCVATVSTAAKARAREDTGGHPTAGLVGDFNWSFRTVLDPGIVSTSPNDGETDVNPYGDVRITFASPMLRDGFLEYLRITPPMTNVYTYWSNADTEVRIRFPRDPATAYTLELSSETPDKYGAPLGEALRLRFTTGDLAPYARLNTGGGRLGTFNAYTDTILYAEYRNVSRLDVGLYALSLEQFMELNGYGSYTVWRDFAPNPRTQAIQMVRQWSIDVEPPLNVSRLIRLDMTTAEGEPLPPGLYYVQLMAPEMREDTSPSRYMFVRSYINLTLKEAPTESLVWATDLASGDPVPDLPIRFHTQDKGRRADRGWHGEGQTDADGLHIARDLQSGDLWSPYFVFAGNPGEDNFAVAFNQWDEGISGWNFDLHTAYGNSRYRGHLYTDRPIYRPGQTVYFKGIVRADEDTVAGAPQLYTLPSEMMDVQVRITDPQGKELYSTTLSLNEMGTFHGELDLDEEAALGSYYIRVENNLHNFYTSNSFRLAEYKKPEYQVEIQTDQDAYLNGDTINVTAQASYYFGGPVANAQVHWSILSRAHWFHYECPRGERCPYYSWRDYEWGSDDDEETYGSYGRLIAEGNATTDNQGRVTFQVPADIGEEIASQRFTLEVSVTDITGQSVSNRTEAIVHKGEFYIGLAPYGRILKAGEEKQVEVLTVDWDSAPVSEQPITVIFMKHEWYSVRQQAENGRYYWTWTVEDIPIYTTTVTTGEDGKALAAFTPEESGSYRVRALGEDTQGNQIYSSTYIWVWGGGRARWRQESNNRIDLIPDRDTYRVGEIAEILIPSPYTGTIKALITIERGHIIHTEVRALQSNSEVLRIPIETQHIPNIFVSVILIQGSAQAPDGLASFKMGVIKLPVSIEEKTLNITLSPDRNMDAGEYYRPRETATYDIKVTDHAGQPVEAELSLRMADLAVLALADEPGPTLLENFWSERGLSVRTSMPLVLAMEAYNRELEPKAKGGGGGGEAEAGFIRTRFADTAFWDPVVRTNANGEAQVDVILPDNLTTWRMQAKGITADTLVGRADMDIVSTLDLLVRPVLPRFFVVGDNAEIATIVHNNTDNALSTDVNLTVEGLTVDGNLEQTVNIPPDDKVKLVWPVTVSPGEHVTVRMEARAGDFYDGREDTLPVYRYSTPEVVGTAGRLAEPGFRQEIIQLPRAFDPTQGELTVKLEGSLTAATQDALDYLEHYPYECVEQTVSRFLPNVLTYQALQEMGIARPELHEKLTSQVAVALQRLYAEQHFDGGWGWWLADESNAYLTAYVIQGMLEAHRAGFTVDQAVMQKATTYLHENLPSVSYLSTTWKANRLAYQIYVLAEYAVLINPEAPPPPLSEAITLYERRNLLSHYGQATLAVALKLLEPEEDARINTLMADLTGDAIVSATGTHWEEGQPDYWNMNTDIRTTGIILWAMARHNPDSDLLPNVVRWLMSARKEGYWRTTQATAWSLMGLIAYMRASGELQGDFVYNVYLNGELRLEGDVSEATIDESQKLQVDIAQLLVDEGNRLIIEREPGDMDRSGEGQLYYTAHLRYFLPVEQVQALDRGITVVRQYTPINDTDDTLGEVSDRSPLDQAQVGDLIRVKLTLIAPSNLHYVVVEDPLPAGCEAVDLGLKTTSVVGERPSLRNVTAEQENTWFRRFGWGWWWFSHSEMRDEKVVLFATYLPQGTYEYTYVMRASVPGTYNVIPTTAYQMYFPEVFGRSDGGKFTVME